MDYERTQAKTSCLKLSLLLSNFGIRRQFEDVYLAPYLLCEYLLGRGDVDLRPVTAM